jgi:hypothetical protein
VLDLEQAEIELAYAMMELVRVAMPAEQFRDPEAPIFHGPSALRFQKEDLAVERIMQVIPLATRWGDRYMQLHATIGSLRERQNAVQAEITTAVGETGDTNVDSKPIHRFMWRDKDILDHTRNALKSIEEAWLGTYSKPEQRKHFHALYRLIQRSWISDREKFDQKWPV